MRRSEGIGARRAGRPGLPRFAGALRAFLGVVAFFAVSACATLGILEPSVSAVSVRPVVLTALEQRIAVTLRIANPNDFGLDIDGFTVDLALNGRDFATGVSQERIQIPRLGETEVQIVVGSDLGSWLGQLDALLKGADPNYAVQGRIFVLTPIGRTAIGFSDAGPLG